MLGSFCKVVQLKVVRPLITYSQPSISLEHEIVKCIPDIRAFALWQVFLSCI